MLSNTSGVRERKVVVATFQRPRSENCRCECFNEHTTTFLKLLDKI